MTKSVGRPRDASLEAKVFAAARWIYAKRGWSGFSFDEVARRSGVGKGSLYLRWPNKARLLIELVRSRTRFVAEIDTGSLRSDLIQFARGWLAHMDSDDGALTYRLNIDARFYPELREALAQDAYPEHIRATRAIVHRGIRRGELPAGTSVALVADLVAGAVSNHARNTPVHLRERASSQLDAYLASVVDTVLKGVRPSPDASVVR